MPRITRRVLLQSTAAIGLAKATKAAERTAAPAVPPLAEARKTYIGAPTSRIDGPARSRAPPSTRRSSARPISRLDS